MIFPFFTAMLLYYTHGVVLEVDARRVVAPDFMRYRMRKPRAVWLALFVRFHWNIKRFTVVFRVAWIVYLATVR